LLRYIDKTRKEIETRAINNIAEDTDLIDLHELESNLVYFTASLKSNMLVIDRLVRYERIKKYSEDKELLDDVVIEIKQAAEMTDIYINIIHGSRELIASVLN
ncbi:magnesium transporter CorA family protein, partial [Pseudomonas aeruginosa]|nr:magnesium transporter CorA family protein [Pseudomonas aeruginosa]